MLNENEYIEYWLRVLADDFSMYLYRTDDHKWCVSPDAYMHDHRSDPHKKHGGFVYHDGSVDSSALHRDTITEAIDARKQILVKRYFQEKDTLDTNSAKVSRQLERLGVLSSQEKQGI